MLATIVATSACVRTKIDSDHSLFDRRIGADLLRGFRGLTIEGDAKITLSIDCTAINGKWGGDDARWRPDGRSWKIHCLSHPFREDKPCSTRAKAQRGKDTIAVDILLIAKGLPVASNMALSCRTSAERKLEARSDSARTNSGDGDREATSYLQATLRGMRSRRRSRRRALPTTANTLSGKSGDSANGRYQGTMCLFRPFTGEPSKKDVDLIRRTDGRAFGATGSEWTVGIPQPGSNGGMRVRYRAASQHMECVSELIVPADAVEPIAIFVKAVA